MMTYYNYDNDLDYDDCHSHYDLQLFIFFVAMLFKDPCQWAVYGCI